MGFLNDLFGSGGSSSDSDEWSQSWNAVAAELGLRARISKKQAGMQGEIDGHRVSLRCRTGAEPRIEVRFESGVRSVDIATRRSDVVTNQPDFPTGDAEFDQMFRTRIGVGDGGEVLEWLTPERRRFITALNKYVQIDEIEEDELEVRLRSREWTTDHLVQIVGYCIATARVLHRTAVSERRQAS